MELGITGDRKNTDPGSIGTENVGLIHREPVGTESVGIIRHEPVGTESVGLIHDESHVVSGDVRRIVQQVADCVDFRVL